MLSTVLACSVLALIAFGYMNHQRGSQLQLAAKENQKLLTTSNQLMVANDDLTQGKLTPEVIKSFLEKHPDDIPAVLVEQLMKEKPGLITDKHITKYLQNYPKKDEWVDTYLRNKGLTHNWERVGARTFNGIVGNVKTSNLPFQVDKCTRCGVINRYSKGAFLSGKETGFIEGFYLGGERLEIKDGKPPSCLQVDHDH